MDRARGLLEGYPHTHYQHDESEEDARKSEAEQESEKEGEDGYSLHLWLLLASYMLRQSILVLLLLYF